MGYRVCIPTAGTGSRLGRLTRFVNKSLISIANRPTLSHLIEQFPEDVEFVIALGHKGHLVREFLELAYSQRRFHFAEVEPFEGLGSGLGLSLLACKQYLQEPFVFSSCDTLVCGLIPAPEANWMGYANLTEIKEYRTLEVESCEVRAICEKGDGHTGTHKPYIGLAGILDYRKFWEAMEQGGEVAIITGEAHGLRSLLNDGIRAYMFTWHDTGNPEALQKARSVYRESDSPNILEKTNEAIWFVDGQVIKFSDDEKFIANRVDRVQQLQGFVPEVTGAQLHMYRYPKVEGKVLSDVVTLPMFQRLLEHCQTFWTTHILGTSERQQFRDRCRRFYQDKTLERVALFYKTYTRHDGTESINGVEMPRLRRLLDDLDWRWLIDGLPGRFHGDLHFENILVENGTERFVFLDWRQDFATSISTGDIYYDLAKLMHGLIMSHELVLLKQFEIKWTKTRIDYDFYRKQKLVQCEDLFNAWILANGYDLKKVRVLTALIYLNIAALHHRPYSDLLYALGKSMLSEELTKALR